VFIYVFLLLQILRWPFPLNSSRFWGWRPLTILLRGGHGLVCSTLLQWLLWFQKCLFCIIGWPNSLLFVVMHFVSDLYGVNVRPVAPFGSASRRPYVDPALIHRSLPDELLFEVFHVINLYIFIYHWFNGGSWWWKYIMWKWQCD